MTTNSPGLDGLKKIDNLIKKVPNAYSKAHDLVQETAVAIVQHAEMYGDCSRALTLARAVPINQARALIIYFMTVSPIGVLLSKDRKDDKVRLLQESSKAYNPFDMDKAKALSWWTMDAEKAQKEAEQVFAGGVFDSLLKQLDRMIENKGASKEYTLDAIATAQMVKKNLMALRATSLAAQTANDTKNSEMVDKTVTNLPVGAAA